MDMTEPTSICVFCGSQPGVRPRFAESAHVVGRLLAERGLGLVYGGGRVGLMGIVADAVLRHGGKAVGVIPESLATREIAHDGLSELHVVSGMHPRKALMASLCSGFLTLPGGVGTFEEFFEILSWSALGLHRKPIGLLNVDGYYDSLIALLDHGIAEGFIPQRSLASLLVSGDPGKLIDNLVSFKPPSSCPRWITLDET